MLETMAPPTPQTNPRIRFSSSFALEIVADALADGRELLDNVYWQLHPRMTFFKSVPPDAKLLDVGAGPGGLAGVRKYLVPDRRDIRMFAIDRVRGDKFAEYEDFQLCDLDRDPIKFPPGFFDAIIATHLIEHLHDLGRFLTLCHGLLRAGGEMYLEFPAPHTVKLPPATAFIEQGLPACPTNFFDDRTHIRPYDHREVAEVAAGQGFQTVAQGTVRNPYIADALLAYGYQQKNREVATYGLWAKLGWAQYVVLQKPDELTAYLESLQSQSTGKAPS